MKKLEILQKQYFYSYPRELIALAPSMPRDRARLLLYDKGAKKIAEDIFSNLSLYVPKNAVMVFNQTKVVPARLLVTKPTGGVVELLYTGVRVKDVTVLANKKLVLGMKLYLNKKYCFIVIGNLGKEYLLAPQFPVSLMPRLLESHGVMPLPPYLRNSPLTEDERRGQYQTIFSKNPGASAAPTASLHFTRKLLLDLKARGVRVAFITLHVGLGTFAPLTSSAVSSGKLHEEKYIIDPKTVTLLNSAKKQGRPIIAVGTTVVRALESASNIGGDLVNPGGSTDLFITEKTPLRFVNSIITNFHVPSSSLLMLVSAFVGRKALMRLYAYAVRKKFRLFSFGDGMYIK